jgi:hypothetical protein
MNANHERGILDQRFSFHQTRGRGNDNTNENQRARTNRPRSVRRRRDERGGSSEGSVLVRARTAPLSFILELHQLQISKKLQRASRLSMVTRSSLYHLSPLHRHTNCWIRGEPLFLYLKFWVWGFGVMPEEWHLERWWSFVRGVSSIHQ